MQINATLINLYHVCKRQMWLHAHGIRMEHNSEVVAEGKLIGETTYQDRSQKYTELQIGKIKIDYYDNKNKVIHEVKKSNKAEYAHIAQVKFYKYVLLQHGIEGASAILEYPKLRQRHVVEWEKGDESVVQSWMMEIQKLIAQENCPPLEKKNICRSCSYYDFCFSGE
ncbi:CRISPR-associated protein Cas4 [Cecembia rubra]|uniref:CRISPR-associated Cas4 family exonuclease n=1 Tax=Cecembia rubra TaxID=1485585 RepID=A0A2P8ECN4_9BACT|nr:CRISPR-associated protein Cas4 [Cecembia rubra]PSL07187.1 CRISPR-associated Cas4 family exonuclease [Cecembia rubra]